MVFIRFKDGEMERRALACLVNGSLPFKTWDSGETAVPESALSILALKDITFEVIGPATYERITPLRDLPATAV